MISECIVPEQSKKKKTLILIRSNNYLVNNQTSKNVSMHIHTHTHIYTYTYIYTHTNREKQEQRGKENRKYLCGSAYTHKCMQHTAKEKTARVGYHEAICIEGDISIFF